MISFVCDYLEGAHPEIMKRLAETNLEQTPGYGQDKYTASAISKIREACGCPEAQVYFLAGGTQTNSTVIGSLLNGNEGVISATSGHINVHEAGAVEYTGHKVLTVPAHLGKMDATELDSYLRGFFADPAWDHMVIPGMVYISHPTEYGTIYSLAELSEISAVAHKYGLQLYLDGARLGYGLMATGTDVSLKDIARLCDVFYIGGTKVGALFGEAVVFPRGNAPRHMFSMIKQHGALLAKGRIAGLQFDTLFTDDLYFRIGRHAIEMAEKMKAIFIEKGYEFFIDSPTNQQFIILTAEQREMLSALVDFEFWEALPDGRCAVRFATSWATTPESIDYLRTIL